MSLKQKIAITSLSSISALGQHPNEIWDSYLSYKTAITNQLFNGKSKPVAQIPLEIKKKLKELRNSDTKYKALDETVLMAILASREAVKMAGWDSGENFGINIGSSRGATQLFETHHKEFIETGKAATLTSPTTTLGNISSWVAHDLKSKGLAISHSITCSTGLHAILNAVAWLKSGMATKFLVGASESPLTDFTLAQMEALKIYSNQPENEYPCLALDLEKKKNTMVLGEAVSLACLELGVKENALAYVEGIGYATDDLEHNISISEEAKCFQESMKMALQNTPLEDVDAIVMHAPGTIKGDLSEFKAIQKLFSKSGIEPVEVPLLTTNKWKLGHTFGTSGMLSVELAILMMQHNTFIPVPFISNQLVQKPIKKVLVNAVGFGGNAVSVLLSCD